MTNPNNGRRADEPTKKPDPTEDAAKGATRQVAEDTKTDPAESHSAHGRTAQGK